MSKKAIKMTIEATIKYPKSWTWPEELFKIQSKNPKESWGPGPWQDEPDKMQWTDSVTGYPCLLHRGALGSWCGYVGVSPGHPAYEIDYGKLEDKDISAHGGLTYTNHCMETGREDFGVCHVPEPGQPDNVWWIGFDCAHGGDYVPSMAIWRKENNMDDSWRLKDVYRDMNYVQNEVHNLAEQLKAMETE